MRRLRPAYVVAFLIPVACTSSPPAPPGTGAKEAAAAFFEAIGRKDWGGAYERLHPESRKSADRTTFERRAATYVRQLKFDLSKVHVRACDEQGDRAVVHLMLGDGGGSSRKHNFRESIQLQRGPEGWLVMLPTKFGRN